MSSPRLVLITNSFSKTYQYQPINSSGKLGVLKVSKNSTSAKKVTKELNKTLINRVNNKTKPK